MLLSAQPRHNVFVEKDPKSQNKDESSQHIIVQAVWICISISMCRSRFLQGGTPTARSKHRTEQASRQHNTDSFRYGIKGKSWAGLGWLADA